MPLNSIGWRGIRQRKLHIEELLGLAMRALADRGMEVRLVDIAAGHGLFGIAVATQNPAADITAVDWGPVLEVAKENAAAARVTNRYRTIEGDAMSVDLGTGYDLALLTNFLHHFDEPTIVSFLKKTYGKSMMNEIVEAAEAAVNATGFEELALLSLSSSDFSYVVELVNKVSERFKGRKLTISLPSLRIESVSIDLMDKLREHFSGGFTLAPEAATERMRRIINKFIPDEELINTTREIYRRGWTTIKLYFMIGHPSETLEDVQAIADLCKRVIEEGRKVAGWKVKLHAGVSTFVPKPQTPFQWVAVDSREQIQAKQALLKRELRDRNIKLSWTEPEDTLLEAWLSRGDRRMAEVIYSAWKNGARFDAWNDHRKVEAWGSAFAEHGLNPDFYTHRQRRTDEVFPWDHISAAVRKNFLFQDFRQSLEGQIRVDCRLNCYACGILPTFSNLRRDNPGEGWKCPDVKSPRREKQPAEASLPVVGD